MNNTSTPIWDLMSNGEFDLAYEIITNGINKDPKVAERHIGNRAICLLHLNRLEEALVDFGRMLELSPDSDSGYIDSGVVLWLLNRPMESIQMWKRGLNTKYSDAAGGVEIPALLYFASIRLDNSVLEKEALTLLTKRWKTKRAKVWPGPIAGFLLGKLSEDAFVRSDYSKNPILQKRGLTKIHFWVGLSYYRQGNIQKYRLHLNDSAMGAIHEPEYYLAKYELSLGEG